MTQHAAIRSRDLRSPTTHPPSQETITLAQLFANIGVWTVAKDQRCRPKFVLYFILIVACIGIGAFAVYQIFPMIKDPPKRIFTTGWKRRSPGVLAR